MQVSPTPMQLQAQPKQTTELDPIAITAKFERALSTIELLFAQVAEAGNQQMLWVMLNELKCVHTAGELLL